MTVKRQLSRKTAKSPEWAEVKSILSERVAAHIAKLCSIDCSEQISFTLRGRLMELKELMALDVPPPTVGVGPTNNRRSSDGE